MIWNEGVIARAVATQTLARKCIVLVDRCNWTGHECDVLAVTSCRRVIDVEIKVTRSDLKADARKDKWWRYLPWAYGQPRQEPVPREWPRRVWKHYYALPAHVWRDELLTFLPSPASGVILLDERDGREPAVARVVRRAKPNGDAYRLTDADVVAVARLANLRMWDAYAAREVGR
ncbi:MAG: hypothetical protein AB7K86_08535 [Rhodospirillales bacterium]